MVGGALNFSVTSGVIATSRDGATWTARVMPPSVWLNAIASSNGKVVAVGGGYNGATRMPDAILSSTDALSWMGTVALAPPLSALAFGNGLFVALGSGDGPILTSTDGDEWTYQTTGNSKPLSNVAFGARTFVVVGPNGTIEGDGTLRPVNDASASPRQRFYRLRVD